MTSESSSNSSNDNEKQRQLTVPLTVQLSEELRGKFKTVCSSERVKMKEKVAELITEYIQDRASSK